MPPVVHVECLIHLSAPLRGAPVEMLIGEEDGEPGDCGPTAEAFDSSDVLAEIVAAYVLGALLSKVVLLASVQQRELSGPVLQLDRQTHGWHPEIDVEALVGKRPALQPHLFVGHCLMDVPSERVLEVGLRVKDGPCVG